MITLTNTLSSLEFADNACTYLRVWTQDFYLVVMYFYVVLLLSLLKGLNNSSTARTSPLV